MKKHMLIFLLLVLACAPSRIEKSDRIEPAPIILISMDGYRWDYMERTETPNMDFLAANGVRAEALIPVFPSITFPNHLSIITGCYPQNHGIISNRMWDPVFEEWYYIGQGSAPVKDGKWYEAEPFWVTVERAGLKSAIYHWPASEAEINGYRPSTYYEYADSTTNSEKIDQVLAWLEFPTDERPAFMAIYFNDANKNGHHLGVEATAMDSVIRKLDDDMGRLVDGLRQRELLDKVNIIIVADHGMVDLYEDKLIFLDDYVSMSDVLNYDAGPFSMIKPREGKLEAVYSALRGAHPHLQVYKKEDTPPRLHFSRHRRISPIVSIADESWYITTHAGFDEKGFGGIKATHGYDPALPSMQAIFLAAGPQFKKGITVPKFSNIHIYELMADILELDGAPNDGSLEAVKAMLVNY